MLVSGCATPDDPGTSRTQILHPDQEDDVGGTFLESSDIRTIAQQMTSAILSTPELSSAGETTRIALAPVRNNTRFLIDSQIFLKRLRIELNRVSQGRVRFFMQDNAQEVRREVLLEQDETAWDAAADEIAGNLLQDLPQGDAGRPIRLGMGQAKNVNITGMNAKSFLTIVRSRLLERSKGRVAFVSDQVAEQAQKRIEEKTAAPTAGVDYLLCGEFVAQAIQVAEGKQQVELKIKEKTEVYGQTYSKENTDEETLTFETRQNPNVTKRFHCQLVNTGDGTILCEKTVLLERKMASGVGAADYILTGEISALSKASQGASRSDYVIVSFQLVDPRSNEVLWEDAYESKRASQIGTVYR
ncbi:MAG: hypothetical protein A2Y76_13810 [Planctomycetes bacterium RBG_13_60_9]|nr:MAG: hypothetical protein A2Y76_13810 [Planctomycetes bacterium RBG_13_60_9]